MSSRRILQTLVLLALLASPRAVEAQARTDIRGVEDRVSFPQTLKYPVAGTVTPTQGHSLSFGRTSRYPTVGTVTPVQEDTVSFRRMFKYTAVGAVVSVPAVLLGVAVLAYSLDTHTDVLLGGMIGSAVLASVPVVVAARRGGASRERAVQGASLGVIVGLGVGFLSGLSFAVVVNPLVGFLPGYVLATAAVSAKVATR